jgi:protein-S-isoprenylcysteine O-methyltransferase Ste14
MLARALFAFVAIPGIVAFAIPILLVASRHQWSSFNATGTFVVGMGIMLLLWCVREFYVRGRGTLAPWSPPQELVTSGPYRFSRNPMYLAVLLVLAGWAVGFRSAALSRYALGVMLVFLIRVVAFEEPWLERTHRESWLAYRRRVRRWI